MSNNHNDPEFDPIDEAISQTLDRSFANLSRRSFLSLVTRKIIGLTGISLAAQVFPYFPAEAQVLPGTDCGLHGYTCKSGTTCNGGTVGKKWVQCCQLDIPCEIKFKCCNYTDYCGIQPPGWGNNCVGNYIPNAISWCGNNSGPDYICTKTTCNAPMYDTLQSCRNNCGTPLIQCTLG